jgi:hypothetical protein
MRATIVLALSLLNAQVAFACTCFTPTSRAESAPLVLQSAKFAIHARVTKLGLGGGATLLVIESFKGPSAQSQIEVTPRRHPCGNAYFSVGEEVFVTSFSDTVTYCDKYQPEPFLLDAFRKAAAK